jgi:ABC-2 type transport system ATP-binding protein
MIPIDVQQISKSFGDLQAVRQVSFTVSQGEIFGLLGPNGAGKTTSLRILLDIFKPDSGQVAILGGEMTEEKKNRIGYMPEERGLYQDISLERCLLYLARLKGLSAAEANARLGPWLERFDLVEYRRKKVKELSKGMQQKAQVISTILHEPELIIVDEPFAALDPLNTRLVIDVLRELQAQGATILMSTHQMHQVEALCNRILLVNQGRNVLYGDLAEIQARFAGESILLKTPTPLPHLDGVESVEQENHAQRLNLNKGCTPQDVLKELILKEVVVESFELGTPSLDDIFIRVVTDAAGRP